MNVVFDLGTSNFRAAVAGSEKIMNEPCVIARDSMGRTFIGEKARNMMGRNPDVIDVATPVEAGVIKDLDGVVQIIQHVAKQFAPSRFARKFSLTLSVPTGLTQVEERALQDAGRLAGAGNVKLINALVCAALGAGLPIDTPTGCLVVNLGAGVTEAAVLSFHGVVASHRLRTGGQAIDEAIVDRVKREHSFLLGLRSAEQLKRHVCARKDIDVFEIRGRNLQSGLPDSLSLSRSLVDDQLNTYCDAITELIVQTISTCPPELVGDIVERGIVLVGGGANMEGVVSMLTARLEVPVVVADTPETCVIQGMLQAAWGDKRRRWGIGRMAPTSAVKSAVVGQSTSETKRAREHRNLKQTSK